MTFIAELLPPLNALGILAISACFTGILVYWKVVIAVFYRPARATQLTGAVEWVAATSLSLAVGIWGLFVLAVFT
jgi:hypothetical protein